MPLTPGPARAAARDTDRYHSVDGSRPTTADAKARERGTDTGWASARSEGGGAVLVGRVGFLFQPVLIRLDAIAQFVAPLLVCGYLIFEIAGHECRRILTCARRQAAWP